MKSNYQKAKALLLTLFGVLFIAGYSFAQVTTLEEALRMQQEMDLHGPTVEAPWAPEGGSRAVGDDCTTPIIIGAFPYSDVNTTVGRGNNYSETCLGYYDGGEDIIYQFTLTEALNVTITMNPGTTTYTGVGLMDGCPQTGTCLAMATGSAASPRVISKNLTAGTYYIMIDTWASPLNIPSFTLNVVTGAIVPPTPGNTCELPILISSFPYTDVNTTVGRGNDYSETCLGSYDSGEDIFYEFTLTGTRIVTITMNPGTTTYTGVGLMNSCPQVGTCLGISTGSAAGVRTITQTLGAGTYFIMIDTWAAPDNIPSFTLNVTAELPPPPAPAVYTSPANGSGGLPTNATLNWSPGVGGGTADGYLVYFGTDNPPTTIANGVDVGNVLTYTAPGPLEVATEYFWQVVPYNAVGNATGNAIWSFTTTLGIGSLEGFTTNGFGIPLGGVNVSITNGVSTYNTVSAPNGAYAFSLVTASPYVLTATLPTYNATVMNIMVAPAVTTYENVVMTRPSMAVTPNPYNVSVNPNEMVNGAMNILNNGDGQLTWTASISYTSPGPNNWLSLGSTTGMVPAYSNFDVPVAFNASGLASGAVKTAEITFTSSPNVGTVVIPVSMTVFGAPLNVPTDLVAVISNPIAGNVTLSWAFTPGGSFQYFLIKRNGVQVGTTMNMTYVDALPTYGVYNYTVQAVFNEGNSAPAGPVSIEWANPTLVLNPTALYNEQYPNSSEAVNLRISNTGEGTLSFSFPEYAARQLVNSPGFTPNQPSLVQPLNVEKGETDPTDGQGNRNLRGAGGPDQFGYFWMDSDETGGPAYVWNDIAATGTLVTGLSDDNVVGPFPLGFSFPFYENTYSTISVSSNGYLTFGTVSSFSNQNIPSTSTPNDVIAWCWDDLHGAGTGSTVHYQNMGNYWVIQFTNYHEYPSTGTGTVTAQVHLYQSGDIHMYYNNFAGGFDLTSATVGIENSTGTVATNINYNSAYLHSNMAIWIGLPVPSFITSVSPASGFVAPGEFVDVTATFTSDNEDFPAPGTYTEELELNTNDLANANVMIPATMVVYFPGMISGTVTSAVDGSPIFGAIVTAGSYSASTNEDGTYSMMVDAGTYTMNFSKTGYTTEVVTGVVTTANTTTTVNAELEEGLYPPVLVYAEVNAADTQTEVTWGLPRPDYEILFDDGTAENYAAWALPGNMNAVKFTPAGYPATITGGKIYVGDGSFPNNNTGFLGTTFGAIVLDDDGANGLPGTTLDSVEVTVNNYGWVTVTGLNATITSGSFYLGMVQGEVSPNVAPIGIDQDIPTVYRSYSRNVVNGGNWALSPFQDMMIRAFVNGPASDDDAVRVASNEVRNPAKQRALISQSAALAQSGVEGEGQFRAIQNGETSRDVTSYKVWRVNGFDPNNGPETGTLTLLNDDVPGTIYNDVAFGPLPEGWYAYAVAANYTNGGESEKAYSNIVGHKKLVDVTVNVSLTTGGSPAGAIVRLTGLEYPYEVATQTVPENGTVVFEDVWKGSYELFAAKVGFDDYLVTPNIQSNRTFNIILLEKKYKPRNLYVDALTLVATWDEPLAVALVENFEGAVFPPAGWQAITQNTTGWFGTSNGGSTNFAIPSHTKYAAVNDDIDNGNGCCDYLITPEMDWTNLSSYRLNFASFYNGTYAQSAYIEISTDAGATWTVVNTLQAAPSGWVDVEVDLTQYSGANGLSSVWLAFHGDDNGEWSSGWAVDDVQIASGGVPFDGYGVFLDGTLVDNTPEETYTYRNLNYGQTYLAGVAALFSSGYSELDTYRFTSVFLYPPDSLMGETPQGTNYAHLWWMPPSSPTGLGDNMDALPVIVAQPAADISTTVNANHTFPQRSIPLSSSRVVLFDNGPLVNSPGTGSGGADESILQGGLGMTTYGSGMQQTAGNSVADDFEVTAPWTIQNFEFFGYQTGSSTTSTFTGIYCRVWDGDPTAGGAIIWGDLTTNRMISTEWANIYRNDNGPGGSTDRPVMRIVAETPGLALTPGTYWVEWTAAGTLGSGPWVPAVTIQGQTTTGNAKQNQSGAWVNLTDVGPQGMPFIINGTGGGALGVPTNLVGYNLYRNDAVAAYIESPTTEYFDMNLDPGTYMYDVTAVYDLTPYGFPGQTGESMKEGTAVVEVSYGYDLPFIENWNTGLFTTNQWAVNGGNWRIAGQVGNPAPAAEFYYNPANTNYNQSLTSSWINAVQYVDGNIWFDFDLKLQDLNATGDEMLKVEVYNGSAWSTVKTITAEGTTGWETHHINISGQAKNKVFRVRFVAEGANTLDIYNWLVDNINIYRVCAEPTDLTAVEVSSPGNLSVVLNWSAPGGGTGPGISGWLAWDSGENGDAIGLQGGGTFSIAARFTPTQLTQYAGTSLTKMRFFPYAPGGSIILKVWTGANASQLVLTQPVASYTAGQWNEVTLNTAVPVTGATELWFGYTVTHGADYVAGCDNGPAVAGFGDMISTDGSTWESMSTAYGLDYNWNLQGFVETIDGVSAPLQPISDNTVYGPVSKLTAGNYPTLPGAALTTGVSGSRALVGYNVYREGTMIATTEETTYTDADQSALTIGETFCYTVTAVYEDCESPMSEEACVLVTDVPAVATAAINVYPNPSNSVVNIDLTSNISQVVVYNYVGQVVFEQTITKAQTIQLNVRGYESGAYLVKFVTTNGVTMTKKVVVTH